MVMSLSSHLYGQLGTPLAAKKYDFKTSKWKGGSWVIFRKSSFLAARGWLMAGCSFVCLSRTFAQVKRIFVCIMVLYYGDT